MFALITGCVQKHEGEAGMHAETRESTIQHCVGRSLIELPKSFVASSVTTGIFKVKKTGVTEEAMDVVVNPGVDMPKFTAAIKKRKAELEAAGSPTVDVLREVKMLANDATLFRVQRIDDAYLSEIIFLRGENAVTVRLHSFENQFPVAEETLIRFSERIRTLDNDTDLRQKGGFCLGRIAIHGDFEIERGSFLFRNGRGAQFEVNVDTYAPDESTSLLQRMSGPQSLLKVFSVPHTVFRAGERTAAGMRAQEWLGSARTTEEADEQAFRFTLETMRPSPSRAAPSIDLTFETAQPLADGSQTKTLVSAEEAIRLWDSVSGSLRPSKP